MSAKGKGLDKKTAIRQGQLHIVRDKLANDLGAGKGYIQIQREAATHLVLSDRAYRLLSVMLGFREGEHITLDGLVRYYQIHGRPGTSKSTIASSLDELEKAGYLVREYIGHLKEPGKPPVRQEDYTVHELPALLLETMKTLKAQREEINFYKGMA